jgi:8-oxo-dGTP pyrophosphatase MutT (NUDIX family)
VDHAELRARLSHPERPSPPPEAAAMPADPALMAVPVDALDARDPAADALERAAVLVGLIPGPAGGVLLTKRTAHLSRHAGQVSFPGGCIDPADAGPEEAALREAKEEIGLDPKRVAVVGCLGDYVTGTGYSVTPVLGLLPACRNLDELGLRPSPQEVETMFILPMAVLLDREAPRRRRALHRGRWREFWVWPHPEHYVWGATAAILVELAARLRGD